MPDPWEVRDEAGNLEEEFKYFDIEFLFDTDEEGTQISELVASIASEFDSQIKDAEIVWDRDDTGAESTEGGVANYTVFPNRPGLMEAFQDRLSAFNVDITLWPTKGM